MQGLHEGYKANKSAASPKFILFVGRHDGQKKERGATRSISQGLSDFFQPKGVSRTDSGRQGRSANPDRIAHREFFEEPCKRRGRLHVDIRFHYKGALWADEAGICNSFLRLGIGSTVPHHRRQ